MKTFRIWLLLLLAVLLPIRGAVASAMLCPPAGSGTQSEMRLAGDHTAHPSSHAGADGAGDAHDAHHHAMSVDAADKTPASDTCDACSAFCSVTSLLSAPPSVPMAQEPGGACFPPIRAAAGTFFCNGQERPPRTP